MTLPSGMSLYAHSKAVELLELIPLLDKLGCDMGRVSVAFMRHYAPSLMAGTFEVQGIPLPASNMSSNILVLTPLVRVEDGKRTLKPVAEYIRQHGITDIRIVGSGNWNRVHQYSRNGGKSWGRMPVQGEKPAPPPAPVLGHIEGTMPPTVEDATEDDLWLEEVPTA